MYQNAIYICTSCTAKFAYFQRKNADVCRTQGVWHVIQVFF